MQSVLGIELFVEYSFSAYLALVIRHLQAPDRNPHDARALQGPQHIGDQLVDGTVISSDKTNRWRAAGSASP